MYNIATHVKNSDTSITRYRNTLVEPRERQKKNS